MKPQYGLLAGLLAAVLLPAMADDDEGEGRRLNVPHNAKYKAECASCHMAYPPQLLPAASWKKLMLGLDKHFGTNAELDAPTQAEISAFLVASSADANRKARPEQASTIRITETALFQHWHDELSGNVFRRKAVGSAANCVACHRGAEQGDFNEHAVRIPR